MKKKLFPFVLTLMLVLGLEVTYPVCAMEEEKSCSQQLADRVDLNAIINLLDSDLQQNDKEAAAFIAKSIYEVNNRFIRGNSQFGYAFPMHPEVLAYMMNHVKGKTVLEIAGAAGENAILLGLSGAKKVYLNDLEPEEIKCFEGIKKCLSVEVSDKLTSIKGSCFDIVKNKPEIAGTVDMILCRNLLHFFGSTQQKELLDLLKVILKKGGKAVFVANSIFPAIKGNVLDASKADEVTSSYQLTTCFYQDNANNKPIVIYSNISPCSEDLIPVKNAQQLYLYKRSPEKNNGKWSVSREDFDKINDTHDKKNIANKIKEKNDNMKNVLNGFVKVVINPTPLYTPLTLSDLLERNGFDVDVSFVVSVDGHTVNKNNHINDGYQVGVIAHFRG